MTDKHVHTIATAHLDTVWNWDFEATVRHCIKRTLDWNFKLFEKYPEYVFNFEGSYRYELMEEYYPQKFKRLKKYIASGRWNPCGSAFENGDVNVPSPEALFRNFLYGNNYFDEKFGKRSKDVFLPDCFGFGYALPSIAKHANLCGFTTQKLSWGSVYGVPFDFGKWYGPDGEFILASLDMHNYFAVLYNLRGRKDIKEKLLRNEKNGLNSTEIFHGIGDRGGAPLPVSVKNVCREIKDNDKSDIKIHSSASDALFKEVMAKPEILSKLPSFNNELLLTNHGTGGFTSRAVSKRWNSRGEILADMAERSAVAAMHLSVADYPQKSLEKSWKRIIAHQFHDDLPGTSIQRVYKRTWNDYGLSLSQLASEYTDSVRAVSRLMDTSFSKGVAVIVNNPLEENRNGIVTAVIDCELPSVAVFDSDNKETPSQILFTENGKTAVAFYAELKPLSYKAYDIRKATAKCKIKTGLSVTEHSLENARYTVKLNDNGDIESVFDKIIGKELLREPIISGMLDYDGSKLYPAWELKYSESIKEPEDYPRLIQLEIIENGAARVSIKTVKQCRKSTFTDIISLSYNSDRVEIHSEIDWNSQRTLLKNKFRFTASNPEASFDLGLGVIKRKNAVPEMYEVPAQKWADLTDKSGEFGVAVLSDCKYGWDKFDDNTLRLTVLHTPVNNSRITAMQSMLDLGLNRYGYAVMSHEGDSLERVQQAAREFSSPLCAFITDSHEGTLGSDYSFGSISDNGVIIRAVKKAENSDEIVIRVNEGVSESHKQVKITMGSGITAAREIYASEEYIKPANVVDKNLVFDIEPYEVKSFILTLNGPEVCGEPIKQKPVALPCNINAFSPNSAPASGKVGDTDFAIPAEIAPRSFSSGEITFKIGDTLGTKTNALVSRGQTIRLSGKSDTLYLAAASLNGDREFTFLVDGKPATVKIADIEEKPFSWDLYSMKQTAKIKTDTLAYEFTHTHKKDGDDIAHQLFIYKYSIDIRGKKEIALPADSNLFILAATEAENKYSFKSAAPLYDTVCAREYDFKFTDKKEQLNYEFRKALGIFWMIG